MTQRSMREHGAKTLAPIKKYLFVIYHPDLAGVGERSDIFVELMSYDLDRLKAFARVKLDMLNEELPGFKWAFFEMIEVDL